MKSLANKIRRELKKSDGQYWQKVRNYLLAVSTGVDSMNLLAAFLILRETDGVKFKVCHINHRLREESEMEQQMLIAYCEKNNIDLIIRIWQHEPLEQLRNLEATARTFRYYTFAKELQAHHIERVLTAHHRDDQVETFVMRLIQGTSVKGAQSMKRISPLYTYPKAKILRPLLHISKKELYKNAERYGIPYCEDRSNHLLTNARNRIRHRILPLLSEENSHAVEHMSQFVDDLQGLWELAQPQIMRYHKNIVRYDEEEAHWQIDIERLKQCPSNQRNIIIWGILNQVPHQALARFSREGLEQLSRFLTEDKAQGHYSLPNQYKIEKVYDLAYLYKKECPNDPTFSREAPLILSPNTIVRVGRFNLEWRTNPVTVGETAIQVPLECRTLKLRHRQSGDWIKLNEGKHQKLRRFFINNKYSSKQRECAWVLVNEHQWVIAILSEQGELYYQYKQENQKTKQYINVIVR